VQPAAILWLMSAGEFDIAGHAERAWQIFSEMIRADKPRPMPPQPRPRPVAERERSNEID